MKQLIAFAAVTVMTLVMTGGALADTSLTYANFPPAKTFPSIQMERWADEVEKRTGGEVTVQTFPGSTLLGPKNMLRGVMIGQADIGCLSTAYYPGVFPVMSVMNLPVGFSSTEVASLTMWDMFVKHRPEEFKDLKVLTMFTSAPSQIMSQVPVRALADLKGLELRASGSILKILNGLGARGVGMPMSQTPENLQKGLVKGLVSSFDVLKDMNFAETCRYQTIADMPVYPFAIVMNKASWEKLSPKAQQVMDELAREQAQWTGVYLDDYTSKALQWAKDAYQVEVFELTEAELAAVKEQGAPLVAEWKAAATAAGVDADAVLADMLVLKAKHEAELGK